MHLGSPGGLVAPRGLRMFSFVSLLVFSYGLQMVKTPGRRVKGASRDSSPASVGTLLPRLPEGVWRERASALKKGSWGRSQALQGGPLPKAPKSAEHEGFEVAVAKPWHSLHDSFESRGSAFFTAAPLRHELLMLRRKQG